MTTTELPLFDQTGSWTLTHLVTGGTGLVGAALILELLDKTEDPIAVLVRGPSPDRRLKDALANAAAEFGRLDLADEVGTRVQAVSGDICRELCGVDPAQLPMISHIWHSAASLRYEEAYATEIEEMNIGGTAAVVALAHALGGPALNYISTCYVAGSNVGRQLEILPGDDMRANNWYERTKIRAEQLVADSGLPVRLLRPSIVVGSSKTLAVTTFSGLYGFASSVDRFSRKLTGPQRDYITRHGLTFFADLKSELNLIPIDLVAAQAVCTGLNGKIGNVFHLSNPDSPTMATVLDVIFPWADLPVPTATLNRDSLSEVDRLLDMRMEFYRSYFVNGKTFDRSNTLKTDGINTASTIIDHSRLTDLMVWYRERITADGYGSFPARASFAYT